MTGLTDNDVKAVAVLVRLLREEWPDAWPLTKILTTAGATPDEVALVEALEREHTL